MARNTFLFLCILAIVAALVVGVNIGRSSSVSQAPTPTPLPTPAVKTYTSDTCGITFSYPDKLSKLDTQGAVVFVDSTDTNKSVAVVCQKDIPRPPLADDKMENIAIGSVKATIYHDASAKDGTPMDKLIFTHPKNKLDIYVSGYGDSFTTVVTSLKITE